MTRRTGWSCHIGRRFFKTWGWKSPAENWIFDAMMGHKIDANNYLELFNDDQYMINQLKKAEPWFNILSSPVPFGLEDREQAIKREGVLETKIDNLEAEIEAIKLMVRKNAEANEIKDQLKNLASGK